MSPEEFASYIPGDITVWKVLFGLVALWVLLEIGFILVIEFTVLPAAQKLNKTQPYHGDMMEMMKRAVDLVKKLHCYDFRTYLSGFCCGAKYEDIHIENFRSFLVWAMYNKHMPDATEEELAQMEVILKYAQDEHPELRDMPEGFNPNVQHCRMTLDPIPIIHRPLLMYVLIMLKEAFTHMLYLPAHGFQRHEVNGQTYWYKKQSTQARGDKDQNSVEGSKGCEPMLFLHGISTGWGGYVNLACAMGTGRDIFLLDLDCVKLNSLQFKMPTPQKFASDIVRILDRHHVDRVSLVGHSFGSMTAGWFLRAHPERISHLTLIDPVSMLLSFPEVAYSFLYRQPSTLMEWIIHVFAAREITVSYTLRRNFWWYNNDLWLEEVPDHIGVVVGVATNDEITNPKAIHEYVNLCRRERLAKRERLNALPATAATERTVSTSGASTTSGDGETTSSEKSGSDSGDAAEAKASSSLESLLATADSFSCLDGLAESSADDGRNCGCDCAAVETVVARCDDCGAVAMIECLVWDNYSHGQILAHSPEHHALVATVRSNEKLGVGAI